MQEEEKSNNEFQQGDKIHTVPHPFLASLLLPSSTSLPFYAWLYYLPLAKEKQIFSLG
jgi:hypothetical protein